MPDYEMYYAIVSRIYKILLGLFSAGALIYLCAAFFRNTRRVWLIGAVYFCALNLLYDIPLNISNLVAYLSAISAACVTALLLERENWIMKIFLCAVFFSLRWFAAAITIDINYLLQSPVSRFLIKLAKDSEKKQEMYLFWFYALDSFAVCILAGLLLFAMSYGIRRAFFYQKKNMAWREFAILMIPAVLGMFLYEITKLYEEVFFQETQSEIIDVYPGISVLWIVSMLVILAVILSSIFLNQSLKKKQEESIGKLLFGRQLQEIRAHIGAVEQRYSNIRSIRHDIANHVNVLQGLLEQEHFEEAKSYLVSMSQVIEPLEYAIKTGHPVTDVILNEKAEEAMQKGIDFLADFHVPSDLCIDVFDLSILLTNGLDNALENVPAGGRIVLRSRRTKQMYLLTIENSFSGILRLDKTDGLPETTKQDTVRHGYGVRNMKAVTEKYSGGLVFEQEKTMVKLTILLQE